MFPARGDGADGEDLTQQGEGVGDVVPGSMRRLAVVVGRELDRARERAVLGFSGLEEDGEFL